MASYSMLHLSSVRARGVPAMAWSTPRVAQLYSAAGTSNEVGDAGVSDPALRTALLRHAQMDSSAAQRRSAAARLGSTKVHGNSIVAMSDELMKHVEQAVRAGNRVQLRRDAAQVAELSRQRADDGGLLPTRAFHYVDGLPGARAATLYLATQFPERHAVLVRVFDEVLRRVVPATSGLWRPQRIVDWNGQAADVLWAAVEVFGSEKLREYTSESWSRDLLRTAVALLRHAPLAHVRTLLRLRGDKPHIVNDVETDTSGTLSTLGVYAYGLVPLPTDAARERQVLRMWKSRADVLVLVEEATPRGFAAIAAARAQLLTLGRETHTCHVVAPCSHDAPCPLLHASLPDDVPRQTAIPLCGHSQMYRVPPFTRTTTGRSRGDAVTDFCYVILQRGERPSLPHITSAWSESAGHNVAPAVGALLDRGRRGVLDALREGGVVEEPMHRGAEVLGDEAHEAHETGENMDAARLSTRESEGHDSAQETEAHDATALEALGVDEHRVLQVDSRSWPRLLRAPLKKGGHVTMDACCASGDVLRFTVAKSAGRQAYQDARKVRAGELFPHAQCAKRPSMVIPSAEAVREDAALTGTAPPPPPESEHLYIGPEARWTALAHGRMSKRISRRAPKRRTSSDARDGARSSRKQSRGDLDEELQAHGW